MPAAQPDRRIRRTRQRLKQALLELINERPFDTISIRAIVDRADVGRSTFYSHFTTKEELLFSGFDEWLRSLTRVPEGRADPRAATRADGFRFSLPLLAHIQEQKRFFLATIVRGASAGMRTKTTALLAELVRIESARLSPGKGSAAREAYVHAVVGAFLALVTWWLEGGGGMTARDVDQVFQRLTASIPT